MIDSRELLVQAYEQLSDMDICQDKTEFLTDWLELEPENQWMLLRGNRHVILEVLLCLMRKVDTRSKSSQGTDQADLVSLRDMLNASIDELQAA